MIATHSNNPQGEEDVEDTIKNHFIMLMRKERIPGVRPMTLKEIYECDILYYLELIKYYDEHSEQEVSEEVYVDEIGI